MKHRRFIVAINGYQRKCVYRSKRNALAMFRACRKIFKKEKGTLLQIWEAYIIDGEEFSTCIKEEYI